MSNNLYHTCTIMRVSNGVVCKFEHIVTMPDNTTYELLTSEPAPPKGWYQAVYDWLTLSRQPERQHEAREIYWTIILPTYRQYDLNYLYAGINNTLALEMEQTS